MSSNDSIFSYDAKKAKIYTTPIVDDLKLTDMQALVVALSIIGERLEAIEKRIEVSTNIIGLR